MPLMVEGCAIGQAPRSLEEFRRRFQCFQESAEKFCSQKCTSVLPVNGLLYVGQREMAATTPEDDKITMIGTEDATTCHMVVLRHTGSGAVCVAHFDGCGLEAGAKNMIKIVKDLSHNKPAGRLELHLFGGFCDDCGTSEEISVKTLRAFHDNSDEIHLETACITDLNDVPKNNIHFPIVYGIAVNVKLGNIFKASFPDHGPDQPLRGARHFTGTEEVLNIYDCKKQHLTIGPFSYTNMDEIDLLCRLPNNFIRSHLSTSPEQEPPYFEDSVRAALVQIRDHPDPSKTVFKDNKPRRYEFEQGNWKKIVD